MNDTGRMKHKKVLSLLIKTPFLSLVLIFIPVVICQGQQLLRYQVDDIPSLEGALSFSDSLAREDYIQEFLYSLRLEGHPTAIVSGKTFSGDTLDVRLDAGKPFSWLFLRKGNLDDRTALNVGYQESAFRYRPLNFKRLKVIFERILDIAQNTGYPFATVRLDSIARENDGLVAAIAFDSGPYISFDTVEITGDSKTKPLYLSRLLRIPPGGPFSQADIDRSLKALQKIPSVQLVGLPELTFQNQTAKLLLPIHDRRINTLDGIIGVLPNEAEDNKLLVTGQFDLSLSNVAGRGRDYRLQWQRLTKHSQSLALSAKEPMLFGSLIDLELSFNLLKEDTSFLNRDFKLELGYRIHPDFSIGFFSRRQAGDLLKTAVENPSMITPDIADFRYNNYGLNLQWNTLDQVFLPRRGGLSELEVGVGNKKILENTALPSAVYEGLDRNAIQYYLTLSVEKHINFTPSLGTLLRMRGGEMANKNLFLNDLFRVGGLNSIRGFNENFFFAKRYVYANFEPRYYFDNYSYFLLFLDWGRIEDNKGVIDQPLSMGGGISLETDGGVFSFVYALGKSNTQLMGFNFSKVHFGYTGRF
jgi:outer membrane protein assembly factor BamA